MFDNLQENQNMDFSPEEYFSHLYLIICQYQKLSLIQCWMVINQFQIKDDFWRKSLLDDLIAIRYLNLNERHTKYDIQINKRAFTVCTVPWSSPRKMIVWFSSFAISIAVKFTRSSNWMIGCACSIACWPPIGYWENPSVSSGQ